jgi:hypothetical protein
VTAKKPALSDSSDLVFFFVHLLPLNLSNFLLIVIYAYALYLRSACIMIDIFLAFVGIFYTCVFIMQLVLLNTAFREIRYLVSQNKVHTCWSLVESISYGSFKS